MNIRDIEYTADDNRYIGYYASQEGGTARPGILVVPEGSGLVDLTKTIARRDGLLWRRQAVGRPGRCNA